SGCWRTRSIVRSRSRRASPPRLQPRESVGAPFFGTDAVVHDEQSVGIVFFLDPGEPGIVASPVGLLEALFEVIAFAQVSASVGRNRAKLVHACLDAGGGLCGLREVGFIAGNS